MRELDGISIKVHVLEVDKPTYKTKKNEITTNVLGICSQDIQFTYGLPGWEGSTDDASAKKMLNLEEMV